jgi:hypothetical protein
LVFALTKLERLVHEFCDTGFFADARLFVFGQVWLGHWNKNNQPFRKSFSVAKYGHEGARKKVKQIERPKGLIERN